MVSPSRLLVVTAFFLVGVSVLTSAQQITPDQALARLQQDPQSVQRIRDEISRRGLSADQVRARLRAAGYPDSLLNQYLSTENPSPNLVPTDTVIDAVRALGLVDPVFLQSVARRDIARLSARFDSTRADSTLTKFDMLPVFGMDVFRESTSRFEPALGGAVGTNYRIGPGDVLALIITGEVERAYSLDVSREGFIVIPQVGQVYVANLTLGEVDGLLYNRLRQSYSSISRSPGATSHYYITVSRIHANQVFVIGEVMHPGSYQVASVGTILTALYAAR